jgi:hypothetical protein
MLLPTWRTLRAIWDVLREADLLIVSGSFTPCMPFGVAAARLLGVRTLVIFTTDSDKVVNAYYTGLQRVMWWWMYRNTGDDGSSSARVRGDTATR